MQRIAKATPDASPRTRELFDNVTRTMGGVPNLIATMAVSPAVAEAYLALNQKLATGILAPQIRERLAIAIGEANQCDYCLAAHHLLGAKSGLSPDEIRRARRADSSDQGIAVLLSFAARLVGSRGRVEDQDIAAMRSAGHTDAVIAEVVAHVALNTLTNYFNHVAATEVDFPAAPALAA